MKQAGVIHRTFCHALACEEKVTAGEVYRICHCVIVKATKRHTHGCINSVQNKICVSSLFCRSVQFSPSADWVVAGT